MRAVKQSTAIRRGEIARAALAIMARHGMPYLSVARVARRVGLVPSGIYRHYRSKDALVDAVLDYIGDRFSANVRAAARARGCAVTRLRDLLERHVALIRENESLLPLIFSREVYAGHPERRAKLRSILHGYLADVADIVNAGQREGAFDARLAPATVAVMFLGLVQPPAILWHLSDGAFEINKHTAAAWPIFCRALRAKTARPAGRRKDKPCKPPKR